jgi:predicted MFS family arabinose efflux permease
MDGMPSPTATETRLSRNRQFLALWAAQFSATAVVYSLSLAGAVLVEEQTQSSAQTGLVILSSILPAFVGSLFAGAVVDRWGRIPSLRISHLGRALVALAFWIGTQWLPIGPALMTIYLVNASGALLSQLAMTGELSSLPELVHSSQLTRANALFQLSMLAAEGLGIVALSPLLIKVAGVPAIGLAGVALYAVALALVSTLPRDRGRSGRKKGGASIRQELQGGWQAIARDRLLSLVAVQATVAATLLLVMLSLVPGLVSRHLGLAVEDAPFLVLPGGLGFVLGSALVGRAERYLSRPVWISLGLIALGVAISLISLLSVAGAPLWSVGVAIFGVGLALAFVIIPARTLLQERPPAELRGRVISAQLALANAAAVLPLLLGGALADQFGILPVMGGLGLIAVAVGAIGWGLVRR